MGEIVNLHRARKQKHREREALTAAENRLAFGRTKAERTKIEAERNKAASDLDARKLDSATMPERRARTVKRSLVIAGHRTSVSLEDAFWRRFQGIAAERGVSVNGLAAEIDAARGEANLSSALRVFVLETSSDQR